MRARLAVVRPLAPLLAMALLAACGATGAGSGTGGGSTQTPSASSPPSAAGGPMVGNRTFVSTEVTGRKLVAGTKVTLTFRDATLSVNAGCNTMSGQYHIVGEVLSVGDLATTEMGCQQDLMAQDDWLAKLLPGATVRLSADSLTLSKGAAKVAFVDRQTTNLPLQGTAWTVDGLISGDTVQSVPAGVSATLAIVRDEARVNTGCNSGSATVAIAAGTIKFGSMRSTAIGCSGDAGALEAAVLAVLQGVQPYKIDGDSLTIGGSGKAGLTLKGSNVVVNWDPGAS